jgi:hypothetical protein
MSHLLDGCAELSRQTPQLRCGVIVLGGEHAAAWQLPFIVLLQQHRPNQVDNREIAGKDADDAAATFIGSCKLVRQ